VSKSSSFYTETIGCLAKRAISFLVDSFVRGIWHIERSTNSAKLLIQPFEQLSNKTCQELLAEGERLLYWAADTINTFEIEFVAYGESAGKQNMWGSL
jgi:hypothetical protein